MTPAHAVSEVVPLARFDHGAEFERKHHPAQPADRQFGRVISCDGARAAVYSTVAAAAGGASDSWSVGKLIAIHLPASRIIGLVYDMVSNEPALADMERASVTVRVELVGEVIDRPGKPPLFRRGVTNYPHIGAPAARMRGDDLKAMHDLADSPTVVQLGEISQDENIPATVEADLMLKRHFAVLGSTGVGKSSSVSMIVRKAISVKKDLRVLILDPHNEYGNAFPDCSVSLDASTVEIPFWMLRFEEFADVAFRGRSATDEEYEILRDVISAAKAKYVVAAPTTAMGSMVSGAVLKKADAGGGSPDTPTPYRMMDVFAVIEEFMGKLEQRYSRYHLRTLKNRLEGIYNDPRYRFMFGKASTEDSMQQVVSRIFRMPHLGRPISVFQLAGLPTDVVNAVCSVLARLSFDIAMYSGGNYEILLICEEAHRYVPQDRESGFLPTRQAIARIAKEGRKYGAYLGVVTQRPGELDPTILSQCSTVFAMRLSNERDQSIIKAAIADSSASTITFISSLGNREAIVFGEGVATTMRMRFGFIERKLLPSTSVGMAEGNPYGEMRDPDLKTLVARMRQIGA
jgi:uncharacterized protein